MKQLKKLAVLVFSLAALSFIACSDGDDGNPSQNTKTYTDAKLAAQSETIKTALSNLGITSATKFLPSASAPASGTETQSLEKDLGAVAWKDGTVIYYYNPSSTAKISLGSDASWLFYNCKSLVEIDMTGFDTSNVTDMGSMFYACKNLKTLDVSNFDTSKVTKMSSMFYHCYDLTELDVSKFDTRNVTDMSSMFYHCYHLTKLDISKFNTSNVTDMSLMFYKCYALKELDVSNFNTSKVTTMGYMFEDCSTLTTIYSASDVDWSSKNGYNMFSYCSNLKGGNGTQFNSPNSKIDATYARVDGLNGQPGYFTAKN